MSRPNLVLPCVLGKYDTLTVESSDGRDYSTISFEINESGTRATHILTVATARELFGWLGAWLHTDGMG